MRYTHRARLLGLMANSRPGYAAYQGLQRLIGDVGKPAFWLKRWKAQVDLGCKLQEHGQLIAGKTLVEVGSGWVPSVPVGFWLCGAEQVHSFDLNTHFIPALLTRQLRWLTANEAQVFDLWAPLVSKARLRERLNTARALAHEPRRFLREAGISLHAPADAAETQLPSGSIDIHYSNNVFEHISEPVLQAILSEATRILRPAGVVLHRIDPGDHFAYSDRNITRVNFLQFSPAEWEALAGNRLAYHNRLREPQFRKLFERCGFEMIAASYDVDQRSKQVLEAASSEHGLRVHPTFAGMSHEELCRIGVVYLARRRSA